MIKQPRPSAHRVKMATMLALFTILAALTLAGCGQATQDKPVAGEPAPGDSQAPAEKSLDYIVLNPGTVYVFQTSDGNESRLAIRDRAELSDTATGKKATGYQMAWDGDIILVDAEAGWVRDLGDMGEGGTTVYKEPKPHFPLRPQVGQTWTKSFAEEFEGAGTFTSKVAALETVETKAGRFEQAARVEVSFSGPEGSSDSWTEWYAPGVGLVKNSSGIELVRIEKE